MLPQAALPSQDSDSWPRFMIALYRNVVRQRDLCARAKVVRGVLVWRDKNVSTLCLYVRPFFFVA